MEERLFAVLAAAEEQTKAAERITQEMERNLEYMKRQQQELDRTIERLQSDVKETLRRSAKETIDLAAAETMAKMEGVTNWIGFKYLIFCIASGALSGFFVVWWCT